MRKAYQYRLYSTKSQATPLDQTLEICQRIYNDTLTLWKNTWEREWRSVSLYESNTTIAQWKKDRSDLMRIYSQVLQNVQMRVDLVFKALFQWTKVGENLGYLQLKGKGRYDSITYKRSGFKLDEDRLYLSKIGDVEIVLLRP